VQEASVLRFGHPLIRSVVVSDATARDRRAVHQRLARIVPRPEDRARHLALGADEADADIAREVEEAAQAALSRGAPEAAAALAAMATMFTPPGYDDDRTRRVRLEAESRFDAGELDDACSLLDEEITKLWPGPIRAQLLRRWARYAALRGDPLDPCLERLFEALAEVVRIWMVGRRSRSTSREWRRTPDRWTSRSDSPGRQPNWRRELATTPWPLRSPMQTPTSGFRWARAPRSTLLAWPVLDPKDTTASALSDGPA